MVTSGWRRLACGAFAFWFAAFGVTRGVGGVCPQHPAGHGQAATIRANVSGAATTLLTSAAAHHDHTSHAGTQTAAAPQTGTQGKQSAYTTEAIPSTDSAPQSHENGGCDCRGECCCCPVIGGAFDGADVCASMVLVPYVHKHDAAATVRVNWIAHLLPFATAPPFAQES